VTIKPDDEHHDAEENPNQRDGDAADADIGHDPVEPKLDILWLKPPLQQDQRHAKHQDKQIDQQTGGKPGLVKRHGPKLIPRFKPAPDRGACERLLRGDRPAREISDIHHCQDCTGDHNLGGHKPRQPDISQKRREKEPHPRQQQGCKYHPRPALAAVSRIAGCGEHRLAHRHHDQD
jgi:hypothetical protein